MNNPLMKIVALCVLVLFFSCGRDNPVAPKPPAVEFISFSEEKIPLPNDEYIYRQGIQIDQRKGCTRYAYRLGTATNALPAGYFADEEGWIFFRTHGSGDTIPLSEPGEHRSIWTSQASLSCEFPSTEGKIHNLINHIDLKVKSENGEINTFSSAFKSNRFVGSRIIVPFANGATTSTGMEFQLQEVIGDVLMEGMYAQHFMYRLNILNESLEVISSTDWYSSLEMPDLRKVILNSTTLPAITANTANQFTQFECYVVSRQGVQEATTKSVYFRAQTGNKPVAMIYPETITGFGQYHYSIKDWDMYPYDVIPSNDNRKNRNLWRSNNVYEAINSPDFKLHLRWGYAGQYAFYQDGDVIISNNPFNSETNQCLNEQNVNYYSKIVAFDLRLDEAPLLALDQFIEPQLVTHENGGTWLRVKNINDNARHCTLSNIANGNHSLEVCAIDLQGVCSNPVSVQINLVPFKPLNNRSGILIVDDTVNHNMYSPETYVNNFYNSVVPSLYGQVDSFQCDAGNGLFNRISPVLMQDFYAVVWHSDNPSNSGSLQFYSIDSLELYLSGGGKLIISGTSKLVSIFQGMNTQDFLSNRLGINSTNYLGYLSLNQASNPFFINAIGLNGLNGITLDLTEPFNSIVNLRKGLSAITYFNPDTVMNYLYGFGCKPVDSPNYPPTQAQYDLYSSKFVAYKYSNADSRVVVFGFPLSYMEQADVETALQSIFNDILGAQYANGSSK
ncbi:MAG: hypothetical protein PHO32_05110 [Candidatus Cloacimonetes bacterium]|nr:hypothetical protein [Candidatus Cloacimonadota bacterium]